MRKKISNTLEVAKKKAENTYNAAADTFDTEPLEFWNRYGNQTVQRLNLKSGASVLDVCCGTGSSAIPAAQIVGSKGNVIAIDLAEDLLKLGQNKAEAAKLNWLKFQRGDMTELEFPNNHFDVVICVFGIFFVPDMESQVEKLWRLVNPGGQIAITTWGPNIFAPAYKIWLEAVRQVRPDLYSEFNPWDRITTTDAVRKLLTDGSIQNPDVEAEKGYQKLRSPEDFWKIALGSGLRWTIDQLGEKVALEVKNEICNKLEANRVDKVETNVIYASATKSSY